MVPACSSLVCATLAVAAWMVWREAGLARPRHYRALRLWGWQLLASAAGAPLLFTAQMRMAALAALGAGLALGALCAWRFWVLRRVAGLLMVPQLVAIASALVVILPR